MCFHAMGAKISSYIHVPSGALLCPLFKCILPHFFTPSSHQFLVIHESWSHGSPPLCVWRCGLVNPPLGSLKGCSSKPQSVRTSPRAPEGYFPLTFLTSFHPNFSWALEIVVMGHHWHMFGSVKPHGPQVGLMKYPIFPPFSCMCPIWFKCFSELVFLLPHSCMMDSP